MTASGSVEAEDTAEELPVLAEPAEGVGPVVDTPDSLQQTIDALLEGTGPVAIDAERAQGFRYTAKAYLIQLRRRGSGTHLVDPTMFSDDTERNDLSRLSEAIQHDEWIIHAASQDLPCLVDARMVPKRIFDTELAGRLLGLPRVGLSTMIETYFGQRLLKEHSAADWSTRPLPQKWLTYAALDVELLVELRDVLHQELEEAGKLGWAEEEFDSLVRRCQVPAPTRVDPWRRTSGFHQVNSPRGVALVRELWQRREELAADQDRAPGRILPDKAITQLASSVRRVSADASPSDPAPSPKDEMRRVPGFNRRNARVYEPVWLAAWDYVAELDVADLPPVRVLTDGPPPPRSWENRHPEAFARWNRVRPATNDLAEELQLPPENLLTPETLRRVAWQPPEICDEPHVAEALRARGAREWQVELLAGLLAGLLAPEA